MQYRILGRTGLSISRVVFGGIVCMDEPQERANEYVQWAVARGVNYFDVAPSYGDAQDRLGPALEPYRKNAYLACKSTDRTADGLKREFEGSLKALRTEYFDVYQLHSLTTQEDVDQAFGPGGAMETLIAAKEQGLVHYLGISAHSEDAALEALRRYDFDTVLFPCNWSLHIAKGYGTRLTQLVNQRNLGLLGMKTLAHRKWLEGEERVYPKSWCKTIFDDEPLGLAALKYTLGMGATAVVPPGNFEQFAFAVEHIDAASRDALTDAERKLFDEEITKIGDAFFF